MILTFFILGLIVGSFLNVVVYRLNVAESLTWERSKCPHCKEKIRWYDNIPVISFVLLRFQCRDCQAKISWQYPLVEIFTGVIFALIGARYFSILDSSSWLPTAYLLGISSFLIAILVYDFLYMEIPAIVLWLGIGWAVAFNLYFDYRAGDIGGNVFNAATYSGTLAAFAAFLFFFSLVAISKEKWMGMGDAYLSILLGLVLGWPKILLGLMLAFALGAAVGVVLILLKKKTMQSQVPFAPFMVLGTFLALFFYDAIANWYFQLFYF